MGGIRTTLTIFGLGAGLMYFWDPDQGRRRRSLLRDRANATVNDLQDGLDKAGEDLRNRARGMQMDLMSAVDPKREVPDDVLVRRARSQMGRYVTHPGSINIRAEQGRLHLTGPILADQVDRLTRALQAVPGVKGVENRLEVHQTAGNVPGLQGQPQRNEPNFELLQENWSPGIRLLAGAGGGLLTLYGMARGGLLGLPIAVMGLGAALRGITNEPVGRVLGMNGGRRAIDIQKDINVNAPVEQVYEFWSNFQNFPRFMEHVKEVRDLGNNRSHWKVAGPAGTEVEWDAIVTKREENRLLAWKSQEGQSVESAGTVRFMPNPQGGTRVTVRMSYNPPAGVIGHAVASLFGTDPKKAMDDDLLRFKSLLETGKTTAEGRQVSQQEVMGRQPTRS
jgi:uncharacterized membrane protein